MAARSVPPRFHVAFSFAGEQRDFVRTLAEGVESALGRETVFFDEWYEHHIAGHDADLKLQDIYGKRCALAVVCVSERYGNKPWTLAEHEAIRARLQQARASSDPRERDAILPIRVGDGDVPGIPFNAIVPDARQKGVPATVQLILDRLGLVAPGTTPTGTTPPPAHPAPIASLPVSPTPGQSAPSAGLIKIEFCNRLGPDWPRLADALTIPSADQRLIAANDAGAEGRGVWDWLERQHLLARLAPACRAVNRTDLADLLPPALGASSGPPGFPK